MEKLGITVFDVAVIAVAVFGAMIGASAGFAHAVLFIASWVASGWIAWKYAKTLSRSVRASPLGKPDRILGAGFGVLCAWVAVGTAFLFYTYLGPKTLPAPVEAGATFPMIKEMASFVEPQLPAGFRTRLSGRGVDSGAVAPPSPASSDQPASGTGGETKAPQ